MLALLLAALWGGGALQDTATARAESLLAVGRAQFARPVIGRYAALDAFRSAARLVPTNPEPLYWQMKVGFYLGSDEGDVLAREAILRILALTPDYQDVWERFETVYRNPKIWRRADRALARHRDDMVAMERRAELAIALEEPQRADSLAAEVLRRRGGGPRVPAYLVRAEAGFDAGRDSAGYAWYDSALAYADLDSTGAMWAAVWMIASPAEVRAQDALPPGERRRFFERFWVTRDPNLLTAGNERIAEHFRRLAYTRRYFRLLHPMNLYQRSLRYRALIAATQRDFLEDRAQRQADPYPGAESDRLLAASRQLPDVRPGDATSSALAGFDARGLIYIRHGPPDVLLRGYFDPLNPVGRAESPLDVEGWLYHTSQGTLSIGFRRASGSLIAEMAGGDFIFLPTNRRQAQGTRVALETDRSALPAPLATRAWSAFFKSAELGFTDAYYKAQGDSAAVVLWDAEGQPVRASGPGLLQLTVPPGGYDLGVDVVSAGVLGRARRETIVPAFSLVELGLSSLALAPAAALLDRDAALRGMPADLVYPARTPLAAYVELYGLATDRSGRSQYHVRYAFEPVRPLTARLLSGARPVVFEFDRTVVAGAAVERLVIEPDKLPGGRYRVTVAVTDLQRNVKSESVAIEVTIR
jgi:hypothetical protein